MRTDDLIRALTADLAVGRGRNERSLALRLAVVSVVASIPVGAFIVLGLSFSEPLAAHGLGPSQGITAAAALLLVAGAFARSLVLARPDAPSLGPPSRLLWCAVAAFGLGIAAEIASRPSTEWAPALIGRDPIACSGLVFALSLPILGAVLATLRSGATARPRAAGGTAGLLAGGLCSVLYVLHCPEDSLLFVAAWHVPAILAVAAVGAALGGRVLRW